MTIAPAKVDREIAVASRHRERSLQIPPSLSNYVRGPLLIATVEAFRGKSFVEKVIFFVWLVGGGFDVCCK